jgi:hypothetical protein
MKSFRIRTLAAGVLAALMATCPALGNSDVLIDEDVQISPAKVRPLEFDVKEKGTRVLCTFHVEQGRSGVRAVLLRRNDVRLWLADRPHRILASTGYEDSGGFSWLVAEPGAYSIVLDNRMDGRDNAVVRLQVRLVSGTGISVPVRGADPLRAQVLVWVSVLLFAVFALLCGWRIHLAMQRRRLRQTNPPPESFPWTRPSW